MVMTTVLLAFLFILGLFTTFFHFPTKRLLSCLHHISLGSSSSKAAPITDFIPDSKMAVVNTTTCRSPKLELQGIFSTFDRNMDGYITKQELKDSLKNIGILIEDSGIAEMVQKVDENNDGLVDLDEFSELCTSFLGFDMAESGREENLDQHKERDLKEAFDVFDGDRDGFISEEELSRVLSCLGLHQGKRLDACKEMIRSVDVDGDGMVNFDEFKRMMNGGGSLIPVS